MPSDDPELNEPRSRVVPLTPVVQGRSLPTLPRVLVVAAVVAIIAFLAGVQLGGGRTSAPIGLVSPPPASPAPQPPASAALPSRSSFADLFDPQAVLNGQPGGTDCLVKDTVGPDSAFSGTGPAVVRTWLATCPQTDLRENVETNLFEAFSAAIPNANGINQGPDDLGMTLFQFTYREGEFKGTITVTAAGANNERIFAITLVEAPIPVP